jgi:hypothetical protein
MKAADYGNRVETVQFAMRQHGMEKGCRAVYDGS